MKIYKGTENSVHLIGGLKEKPEVYETLYGLIATAFLATKYSKFNKETQKYVDDTEWHRLVVKDDMARMLNEEGSAGQKVEVDGYLRTETESFEEKQTGNQKKITFTAVWVDKVKFTEKNTDNN